LPHYQNFRRQCANLRWVKERLIAALWPVGDVHIIDGVPLPLCSFARARQCQHLRESAAYGYCAAKKMTFWGIKGYPLMRMDGVICSFWSMPANVDERCVLEYLMGRVHGLVLGDKGFQLKQMKQQELLEQHVHLLVPARKNMKKMMTEQAENHLKNLRRLIETAIGQLCERFALNRIKARSSLAFFAAVFRKILAYNLKITP
jgi:Transposase DDE domain